MENNDESQDGLVSDELLEHLNDTPSFNPNLGTEKDPHRDSYEEFLDEIDNSVILEIDPTKDKGNA